MSDSIIIIDSAALAAPIRQLVDRTLAADRKGGEALWEKCCAVADAKAQTKRGEWESYLSACGMHERAARRLLGIAYRGRQSEEFREKVISGWLPFAVAAIVAHADDAELHRVLSQPEAPTRKQITAAPIEKPDTGVRNEAPQWVCPECRREQTPPKKNPDPDTICTTCAINREVTRNSEAAQREYALTARRNRLINRATKLGYGLTFRTDGIRITKGDIPMGGARDLDMLEELLVDWERNAVAPAAPPAPAAAQGNGLVCAHCGWKNPPALYTKYCDSCYSLKEAQKWESGSEDMRWRLKHAEDFTKQMPPELRESRLAEIHDVAAAHGIDLAAPIAPLNAYAKQAAEVKKYAASQGFDLDEPEEDDDLDAPIAPPRDYATMIDSANNVPGLAALRLEIAADKSVSDDACSDLMHAIDAKIARLKAGPDAPQRMAIDQPDLGTETRYQHAETLLAAVIEVIPDEAIELVTALLVRDYDPSLGSDPREELWLFLQGEAHDNPARLAEVL